MINIANWDRIEGEYVRGRSIFNLISLYISPKMSNKTVWVVIVVLVLAGLYYWSTPAAPVEEAPVAPVVDTTVVPVAPEVPVAPVQ